MTNVLDGAPRLLVSVRSAAEAVDALAGGADIIDIKEPTAGPLGQATTAVIRAVLQAVHVSEFPVPVTAAFGELSDAEQLADVDWPAEELMLVKVGLANEAKRSDWDRRLHQLRARWRRPIAPVAYADVDRALAPPLREVVRWAIEQSAPYFVIDTFAKDGRNLWQWLTEADHAWLMEQGCQHHLPIVLAGSLTLADLDRLLPTPPAVVGIRGAACRRRDRQATIDPTAIQQFKGHLLQTAISRPW